MESQERDCRTKAMFFCCVVYILICIANFLLPQSCNNSYFHELCMRLPSRSPPPAPYQPEISDVTHFKFCSSHGHKAVFHVALIYICLDQESLCVSFHVFLTVWVSSSVKCLVVSSVHFGGPFHYALISMHRNYLCSKMPWVLPGREGTDLSPGLSPSS